MWAYMQAVRSISYKRNQEYLPQGIEYSEYNSSSLLLATVPFPPTSSSSVPAPCSSSSLIPPACCSPELYSLLYRLLEIVFYQWVTDSFVSRKYISL